MPTPDWTIADLMAQAGRPLPLLESPAPTREELRAAVAQGLEGTGWEFVDVAEGEGGRWTVVLRVP